MAYRKYKYGRFKDIQLSSAKEEIRKSIFFLLLYADPAHAKEYENVDVNKAFKNVMYRVDGLSRLLFYPPEIVKVQSLLEEALYEYNKSKFDFMVYRKLVLDAGSEILKIKECDCYA